MDWNDMAAAKGNYCVHRNVTFCSWNDRDQDCFAASSYKFQLLVWSFGDITLCVLALAHWWMFLVGKWVRSLFLSRSRSLTVVPYLQTTSMLLRA